MALTISPTSSFIDQTHQTNRAEEYAYAGSSCIKGSACVKINLRQWKDCDTLALKIGFIVGKSIQFVVVHTINLAAKAVKVLRLNKLPSLVGTCIRTTGRLTSSGYQKIKDGVKASWEALSELKIVKSGTSFVNSTMEKLKPIFLRIKQALNSVFQAILSFCSKISTCCLNGDESLVAKKGTTPNGQTPKTVTTQNNFLALAGKFVCNTLGKCKAFAGSAWNLFDFYAVKPAYNRIIELLNRTVFSSLSARITGLSPKNSVISAKVWKSVKVVNNWTLKPLFNHVVKPGLTACVQVLDGLCGGVFAKRNAEKEKTSEVEFERQGVIA